MKLTDREWKPIPITNLFDRFEPGNGKGLNHLEQVEFGIPYIGATNRNNGVLCFVKNTSSSKKIIQKGNCIGFIKNGDGSAGYAIYRQEPFISTSDVIYGYSTWINMFTGLFFVAAQDLIQSKYSHGYKRNSEHLKGDRVMLPVTQSGEPDYYFMEEYAKELIENKKAQYRAYVEKMIESIDETLSFSLKKWHSFIISDIFEIKPGKRLVAANSTEGERPFIGALDNNNGVARFVSDDNVSKDKNVLGVNYNGNGMVIGFYHPYECIFSDDVKRFHLKHYPDNEYVLLFMKALILKQKSKFGYLYKFNAERMAHTSIMMPVDAEGNPDYAFMEQYGKMLVARKYKQYLDYLDSQKIK